MTLTNIHIRDHQKDEHDLLHVPLVSNDSSSCETFDVHLIRTNPILFHKAKSALQNRTITLRNTLKKKKENPPAPIINVHQREIAHVSSTQYGGKGAILASGAATTCHIMAIRSYKTQSISSSSLTESSNKDPIALGSMTHIDSVGYDTCIRNMFEEHVNFHRSLDPSLSLSASSSTSSCGSKKPALDMDIHLVGGYCDKEQTSIQITKHLLQMIVKLASNYSQTINMNLETCVVSSLNDDAFMVHGTTGATRSTPNTTITTITTENDIPSRPIARGMALHIASGTVQLLEKIDPVHLGPGYTLRQVRLFSPQSDSLLLVHNPFYDEIRVSPFGWKQDRTQMHLLGLLQLPDHLLLQYMSTSPECEDDDFCETMRNSFIFMRDVSEESVFGKEGKRKSVVFQFHPDLNIHVSDIR
jgi:hypothetical protein